MTFAARPNYAFGNTNVVIPDGTVTTAAVASTSPYISAAALTDGQFNWGGIGTVTGDKDDDWYLPTGSVDKTYYLKISFSSETLLRVVNLTVGEYHALSTSRNVQFYVNLNPFTPPNPGSYTSNYIFGIYESDGGGGYILVKDCVRTLQFNLS